MKKDKVIVVIPAYNSERTLSKSIQHGLENMQLLIEYTLHRLGIKKADFLTKA